MKKFFAVLFLSGIFLAFADDGGTRNPSDWTFGNIYVKEPNQSISLENEFLYVNQYSRNVKAVFDFKNLTNKTVKVPCAFPVVIKTHYEYDGESICALDFHVQYDSSVLSLAFDKTDNLIKTNPIEYDKKLRIIPIEEYNKIINDFNKTGYSDIDKKAFDPVNISLNGKNIPVTQVGIETEVIQNPEKVKDAYGEKDLFQGEIILKLHFYHEIEFPAGSSTLKAEYAIDTRKGARRGEVFKSYYDIFTGGTWYGNIKNFILLTDGSINVKNSNTNFECKSLFNFGTYNYSQGTILAAKNYAPSPNEYFEFSTSSYDDEMPNENLEDRKPFPYVKDIYASSFLPGNFSSHEKNYNYEPSASFDGDLLNGWTEGVQNEGIGEWIQFTLTKPALGPFMTNGLTRMRKEPYFWNEKKFDDADEPDSWYYKNNRIKEITMENISTHEKKDLSLKDIYAGEAIYGEQERGWINKNANQNISILFPGTYRLYIKDVYKSEKWNDTVLGEVWFYYLGDTVSDILKEERNSKRNFFLNELQKQLYNITISKETDN